MTVGFDTPPANHASTAGSVRGNVNSLCQEDVRDQQRPSMLVWSLILLPVMSLLLFLWCCHYDVTKKALTYQGYLTSKVKMALGNASAENMT